MAKKLLDVKQLAKELGVTTRSVANWIKKGLPRTSDGRKDLFDLAAVREWVEKNLKQSSNLKDQLLAEKIEHERYKKELTKMQLGQQAGKLIAAEEAERQRIEKFRAVRNKYESLTTRVGWKLEGKPLPEIEALLAKEIGEILKEISEL